MNIAASATGDVPARTHPRLAYLLSIYPATSHTFFLNEITELRKLGFTIDVASINRPAEAHSEPEESALASTYYLKATKPATILLVLLKVLFTRPQVVAAGIARRASARRLESPRQLLCALLPGGSASIGRLAAPPRTHTSAYSLRRSGRHRRYVDLDGVANLLLHDDSRPRGVL